MSLLNVEIITLWLFVIRLVLYVFFFFLFFFFQSEDGLRVLVRFGGLGDVYKGQVQGWGRAAPPGQQHVAIACGRALRACSRPSGRALIHT